MCQCYSNSNIQILVDETNQFIIYFVPFSLKLHIQGGGSLSLTGNSSGLLVHEALGDKTGRVSLRETQSLVPTMPRVLLPYALMAQRDSNVTLPPQLDCKQLHIILRGTGDTLSSFICPHMVGSLADNLYFTSQITWTIGNTYYF